LGMYAVAVYLNGQELVGNVEREFILSDGILWIVSCHACKQ